MYIIVDIELLSLSGAPPASLRTYLSAAARQAPAPASLHLLDLLWKVLEKAGDPLAAAQVLEGLATKPGLVCQTEGVSERIF